MSDHMSIKDQNTGRELAIYEVEDGYILGDPVSETRIGHYPTWEEARAAGVKYFREGMN
jgi:hypothetical protein